MSSSHENVGAMYQRLADKFFTSHISRNIEVYVHAMVIKSKNNSYFLCDVKETFKNLRQLEMKLNPEKCLFSAKEGKFGGHMITKEGRKENPKNIDSLMQL